MAGRPDPARHPASPRCFPAGMIRRSGRKGRTPMTSYEDKPWLAQLTDAQRAPVQPPPSTMLHAFRAAVGPRPRPHRARLLRRPARPTPRPTRSPTASPPTSPRAASGAATGSRSCCRTPRTSCSPCSARGRRAAWSCRSTPCTSRAEMRHILDDAEVTALICADRAWEAYLRETAAEAPSVRIALTACELDLQTRDDRAGAALRAARPAGGRRRPADRRPSGGRIARRPTARSSPPTTSR